MLEKTNKKETPLRANEQTIISRCLIWSLCSNSTNLAVFVWLSQWTRLVLILEQERQGLFQGLIPVPFNEHSKSQDSANSFSLCWGHYLSMFLKKNKFSSSGSKGHTVSGFWKKKWFRGQYNIDYAWAWANFTEFLHFGCTFLHNFIYLQITAEATVALLIATSW